MIKVRVLQVNTEPENTGELDAGIADGTQRTAGRCRRTPHPVTLWSGMPLAAGSMQPEDGWNTPGVD